MVNITIFISICRSSLSPYTYGAGMMQAFGGSCKGKLIWGYTECRSSGMYSYHPQSLSSMVVLSVVVPKLEWLLRII